MIKEYDKIVYNYGKTLMNIRKNGSEEEDENYDHIADQPEQYQSKVTFQMRRKTTFGINYNEGSSRGSKEF